MLIPAHSRRRRLVLIGWLSVILILLPACDATEPTAEVASTGAVAGTAAPSLFTDISETSGVNFHHFNGMTGALYMPEIIGSGLAVVDFDRDGDLDLFFAQGQPYIHARADAPAAAGDFLLPPTHDPPFADRLYENRWIPDGELRFVDRGADLLPAAPGQGMGVTALDFDNDGWMDLYITRLGANQLLRNVAGEGFSDVTRTAGVGDPGWGTSAAACDLDGDGAQELIVGNYVEWDIDRRVACTYTSGRPDYCGPDSYPPALNRVYHNLADGRFEEIGVPAGLAVLPGSSLGIACADFDRDNRLDIYIANDQMANELWMNQGGMRFENQAQQRGAAVNLDGLPEASMGVVAADLDRDGDSDLFMTHLLRESNTLYENDGGYFLDRSRNSGMRQSSWMLTGFGVGTADFNTDGWLDFYVANGAVILLDERLAVGDPHPLDEPDQLYLGQGDLRFRLAGLPRSTGEPGVGRGVAVADLDNDGDSDVIVSNNAGPARLYRNDTNPPAATWVGLTAGDGSSASALYEVEVRLALADQPERLYTSTAIGSYLSSGDPRILIHLPDGKAKGTLTLTRIGAAADSTVIRLDLADLKHGRYHAIDLSGARQ